MRKFVLLFVLAYPLVSMAQRNDIYFIPKKAETIVILEDEDPCYEDEYVEENYADDSYVYDEDDFRYSTRIVRFRNTNSCLGSPLYWDLMYQKQPTPATNSCCYSPMRCLLFLPFYS